MLNYRYVAEKWSFFTFKSFFSDACDKWNIKVVHVHYYIYCTCGIKLYYTSTCSINSSVKPPLYICNKLKNLLLFSRLPDERQIYQNIGSVKESTGQSGHSGHSNHGNHGGHHSVKHKKW